MSTHWGNGRRTGASFAVAGAVLLCLTALGIVGFGRTGALGYRVLGGSHRPIADWDYPDRPNTHPIKSKGPIMRLPSNVVDAKDNEGVLPSGLVVRLVAISKGNTENWQHWWKPDGGPLDVNPRQFNSPNPDTPARSDGPYRGMLFEVKNATAVRASYLGYIPETAHSNLSWEEKRFHGWDIAESPWFDRYEPMAFHGVYVDDPEAHSFLYGIADGEWVRIASRPGPIAEGLKAGDVLMSGVWGRAVVKSVPRDGLAFSAAKAGMWNQISLDLQPLSEPYDQELMMKATDSSGKELSGFSAKNQATLDGFTLKKIAKVEIFARPYNYIRFKDVHFDPDNDQWKDIVWGPQKSISVGTNHVAVELLGLIETAPGTQDWNKALYVTKRVLTVDGKVWRDYDPVYDNGSTPKVSVIPVYNPATQAFENAKPIPQPMLARIKFERHDQGSAPSMAKMKLYGSDSDRPGVNLHSEWCEILFTFDNYSQPREIPQELWLPFVMKKEAKYAQLEVQVAAGDWQKVGEIKPNPDEIKPSGPEYRTYSLELANKPRVQYRTPRNPWIDREVANFLLSGLETRVFVRLKNGTRLLQKPTHFSQVSLGGDLYPCYDFDRDATETEGDMIALSDVDAFEIEGRRYVTSHLVWKLPGR